MLKLFKIKVTSVDYCVDAQDIDANYEVPTDLDDDDLDEWFEIKIDEIKATLPQTMELEVEAYDEDLEDMIADAISEETGWLNNSFTYEIISEEEVEDDDEFEMPWGGTERREMPWDYTHDDD